MKKVIITALASVLFIAGNAQVVMTNNFSEWIDNKVIGWDGNSTSSSGLTITKVTEGAVFGTSAVQLENAESTHKRFSSDPIAIEATTEYQFKYYAKGRGDIRIGVLDEGEESFGFWYSTYFVLNSEEWIEINQSAVTAASTPTGQFIFSVRNTVGANGHIQIDSVSVSTGSSIPSLSIYEIQFTNSPAGDSQYMDQSILTGGIVTGVRDTASVGGYYLQAGSGPWSGIYVFDPSNSFIVAIGDSITLGGVVEERFNNTQIKNVIGFTKVSSGNTVPEPTIASTGILATEPYEGVLVRATEATCTSAPNSFSVWGINDGSGIVRVGPDLYSYSPVILNSKYNVTGPMTYAFSEFRILPRSAADVSIFVGVDELSTIQFEMYPNPAKDNLSIRLSDDVNQSVTIEMIDLTGKMVQSKTFRNQTLIELNTNDLSTGLYIVQIKSGNNVASKLVSIQ